MNELTPNQMRTLALFTLMFLSAVTGIAQTAHNAFMASVEKLARNQEQIRPEEIEAKAREAFEQFPDETRTKVDAWLGTLPPYAKNNEFSITAEFGKTLSVEEVDAALKQRPTSARLFMQAISPQDLVWLVISQVESMGLRKERQSFQIARMYLKPRVELISRNANEVRLAIYDFDSLIELTAVPASVGVLCPCFFRVLEKGQSRAETTPSPSTKGIGPGAP